MAIFLLSDEIAFPAPHCADHEGLLAVGGDLSPQRLLLAYRLGIFPWYSRGTPILWWSPDPRMVIYPDELKVSGSLNRVLKKQLFKVTFDQAFDRVVEECATVRCERGEDTWIVPEMMRAYRHLHRLGYAHSVESWLEGELVGGLYGVSLGSAFFGESMFMRKSDASKVAFVHLARLLQGLNFRLIDCQVSTQHLQSLGARDISRCDFLMDLTEALKTPTHRGSWSDLPHKVVCRGRCGR